MKKILVLVLLVTAGVSAWWFRGPIHDRFYPPETTLVLCGNIEDRQVNLAFSVSERITELTAEEGDIVKKGDLLGSLETVRLEKSLAVAQAALNAARENLKKAESGSREEEIAMSEAAVKAAEARVKPAKNDYLRQIGLHKDGAVSSQSIAASASSTL